MGLWRRFLAWKRARLSPDLEPRETRTYLGEPRDPEAKQLVDTIATVLAILIMLLLYWRGHF